MPEVYGYDACPNNLVGGAYILQERVCNRMHLFSKTDLKLSQVLGQRLDDIWYDHLTLDQRVIVMKRVSSLEGELFKTRFPPYWKHSWWSADRLSGWAFRTIGCEGSQLEQLQWPGTVDIHSSLPPVVRYFGTFLVSWIYWGLCGVAPANLSRRGPKFAPFVLQIVVWRLEANYRQCPILRQHRSIHGPFCPLPRDIRTSNILVAYDDPTRVVAIIYWEGEGARVLPMWSCFMETQVAEPLFTTSEQYIPLRELRKQIMLDMEPGLSLVDNEVRLALVNLH